MRFFVLACAVLLATPALGQGNESSTAASQAESPDERGEVQIGAGSTAAATTGSSGPSGARNPTVPGGVAPFSIAAPRDAFDRPGMLPIAAPQRVRCDLIDDRNARTRCERRAAEATGGVSD